MPGTRPMNTAGITVALTPEPSAQRNADAVRAVRYTRGHLARRRKAAEGDR